jgi:hypothetical protein
MGSIEPVQPAVLDLPACRSRVMHHVNVHRPGCAMWGAHGSTCRRCDAATIPFFQPISSDVGLPRGS